MAILLLNFISYSQGQTGSAGGIIYTYDAAGNRIHRFSGVAERKAAPDAEEKKETAVVSKNNLQASFTPNPTTSGNFSVVVSKNDLRTDNKTVNAENPRIFVYNPLGELIHQESTQYNTQAIINLSAYSKGIYIVKVQSGEDVLMHRMAYQ